MRKIFALAFAALLMISTVAFTGCAGWQNMPSTCDKYTEGESVLCGLADKIGVRLEDIGNVLIVANTVAIGEGVYTKEQANEVFTGIINLLGGPSDRAFITYDQFRQGILDIAGKYPGLVMVASSYLDMFLGQQQIITPVDKEMLVKWFEARIQVVDRQFPEG